MAKEYKQPDALQQLKAALKQKKPHMLYVFHGEETFLMQHYLQQLKKLLLDPVTESFNFHKLGVEEFSVQAFVDSVDALPMMAETTMVLVDEIDIFKLPEDDRNRIAEALSDIPDYCTVVFSYSAAPFKPDKRLKKLWEALSSHGQIVEFAKQSQRDLIPWVGRHFAAEGKSISTGLCSYLIDLTGGAMTLMAGEIAKVCAYSGSDVIVKEDIDAVVEPVLDAVVFQMTDLMAEGNYGAAFQKLQQLFKQQQEPLSILGAIGNHFRRLSTARVLMEHGRNASELARLCGIPDYPARKIMDAARRFSVDFCKKAAQLVLETDRQIKTSADEPKRLLELLVLNLAQEARRD